MLAVTQLRLSSNQNARHKGHGKGPRRPSLLTEVTTNGAGLNPNAKVWQEMPAHQNDIPEGTEESAWLHTYPPPAELTDEEIGSDIDYPDVAYTVFDPQCELASDDLPKKEPMSEEILRETLKKQLEFCFSRENLYKDLYLMSQMDSDQFVPIWTVACMEHIKSLTTDVDLIRQVLEASPMVQVDETGEKVRPNHSRCIIILREVDETTPVEEVEALFNTENCPKALSVEFAHNCNWYITFKSDMDAQQAFKYLREEVITFQGKPIKARIKAINSFFGINTFCNVDSSVYSQQAQFGSPVYMQQAYSPQQSYPLYPVVSPSWNPTVNPSVMSYFDTPVAPFPNSAFMNGYISPGNYKVNSSSNTHRPISRNRNHMKGHQRPADELPSPPAGTSVDGHTGPLSTTSVPVSFSVFSFGDLSLQPTLPNGDLNMGGRARRGSHRGMRRKKDEEHTSRTVPLIEAKVSPPPKFDLATSNFPPLPGCVVSVQGETVPETRLSDVVRGLKVTTKTAIQGAIETPQTPVSDSITLADKPTPVTRQPVAPPISSVVSTKEEDKAEVPMPKGVISSTQDVLPVASEHAATTCTQPTSPKVQSPPSTLASDLGSRKLSYAEVCQRLSKDPSPVQMPSPPPPPSSATQPLQELEVNRVEEPWSNSKRAAGKPEQARESCPPRQPLRSFRGANGRVRATGLKNREHHRGPNTGKQFSQQRPARQSGKEQNIPPRSPK
ncbi:la-related protein 4 isoform X2 [Betta splendens]|uniref:La-related protein 4 isoform X2 n=1 Tax=Betta splendens TaxID=158456 RepID=A0A9W2XUC5_BETSP|nr:la-related protein 4 isoform X2 [Betta splendens]